MKKDTITLLQNFAQINQGILIRPGNTIRTLSVPKTVFASAVVDEDFPREFAIYDLPEFLSTLAMFKEPQVNFEDKFIKIVGDGTSVTYHYSSPNVVVAAPDKNPSFKGDPSLSFKLTRAMLAGIEKAAGVLRLKEVKFDGKDGSITVFNRDNTGNDYRIELVGHEGDGEALLSVANLNMISDDYDVKVDERSVHFTASNGGDLTYVVVREREE